MAYINSFVRLAFIDYPKQVGLEIELVENLRCEDLMEKIKSKYDSKEIISTRFLETLEESDIYINDDKTKDVCFMLPDEELLVFFDRRECQGVFKINSPLALKSILDNCGSIDIYITNTRIDYLLIFMEEGIMKAFGSIVNSPYFDKYRI